MRLTNKDLDRISNKYYEGVYVRYKETTRRKLYRKRIRQAKLKLYRSWIKCWGLD